MGVAAMFSQRFAGVSSTASQMVPLINTASDVLMTNLGVFAESGESFDIYK